VSANDFADPESKMAKTSSTPNLLAAGFADPAHWAVGAFSASSMMLGIWNAGLIGSGSIGIIIPVALIFGGLVQLIVAMIEIGRGSLFGAVAFGTYGPFWIVIGLYLTVYAKTVPAADAGTSLALFLWMFAIISFYLFIASLRTDVVLAIIIGLIVVALVLLALGNGMAETSLVKAGGYVTIVFAIFGFYHAAAGTINGVWGKEVLKVGSLSKK